MNREVLKVLIAQFLTAFADNAVLFTAITMVFQENNSAPWYVPALQASFLVAFVLFAPWVGPYADSRSKPTVLFNANIIKALGAGLLLLNVDSLLAYAVIGVGAAMYSPAKYGILPELVGGDQLVKANGWIEGSTILAILLGTLVGAIVAEYSVPLSLMLIIVCFLLSSLIARLIVKMPPKRTMVTNPIRHFFQITAKLVATPRARFSVLAVSLFWSSASVLRVLLVAWAPVVLLLTGTTEIAQLTLFIALGIACGAVIVPKFIPLAYLRRARMAAYIMGGMIVVMSQCTDVVSARIVLFIIGIAGGMFVVPINAALQDIGHRTIGSGSAVGVQNFFENAAMLIATGLYALSTKFGGEPVWTMFVLGVLVVIAAVIVSWHLPKDENGIEEIEKSRL